MGCIAVADDDEDMLAFYEIALGDIHEVLPYSSGKALLADVASRAPDCIVCDIDLGDMHGIEVLRALRLEPKLKGVPVLAVTAHSKLTMRAKYLSEGFDDYIAKPVSQDVLLATVESALRGECMPFRDDDFDDYVPVAAPNGEILKDAVRQSIEDIDRGHPETARTGLLTALLDVEGK